MSEPVVLPAMPRAAEHSWLGLLDVADVVLDVRAWPYAAREFTATLRDLGFIPAGTTWNGRQYRWVHGEGQVDVLIARFLGERAQRRSPTPRSSTTRTGDGT